MKIKNKQAMALSQIFLLIGMAFAVSYIIYESDFVSAAGTLSSPSVCCERTDSGAWCINTDEASCNDNYKKAPTSCDTTSYCKLGTCYESVDGICMENTPKRVCDEVSGAWDARDAEEVPQCQLGCCIISDQAAFVPLVRCKRLSTLFGVPNDYRTDITNEIDCIAEAQGQDVGACVYEQDFERVCEFTTRRDCGAANIVETVNGTNVTLTSEKRFYENYLCSAEELSTSCARQSSTGCYSGKVYWFDSCGNRENIYSSDKEKSWNRGKVVENDEDVCGANGGTNNNCGNCDYLLGSRCSEWDGVLGLGKPEGSDYYCKKTECTDSEGNARKNGESWCVYDGSVGDGNDPVGSRHYKEVCVDGEVRVEACADFRQEVCIEGNIETDEGDFGTAACRVNRWQSCASQEDEDDCLNFDRRDCVWLPAVAGLNLAGVNIGGGFSNPTTQTFSNPAGTGNVIAPITGFASSDEAITTNRPDGVCVPNVPVGLEFWEDGEARGQCGSVNAKCLVVFEESTFGGKQCVENCECLEDEWALAVNKVCAAVGDCGGWVNYNGKYSEDGYEWKHENEDKEFEANDINKIRSAATSGSKNKEMFGFGTVALGLAGIGLVAGVGDFGLGTGTTTIMPNLLDIGSSAGGGIFGNALGSLNMNANWLSRGAWNSLLVGGVVYVVAQLLGEDEESASIYGTAVSAGLFAGELAGQWAAGAEAGSWWVQNAGLINLGVTIGVAILVYYLLHKDIEIEEVTFTCMPWQAPNGGNDCEVCNNPDLPCSEYRCKSLGQACELVNAGTENEQCVYVNPRDTNPPIITPNEEELTLGYEYTNVKPNPPNAGLEIVNISSAEGCVRAFEKLKFGVDTNEPAECRIDVEHKAGFDEMSNWMGGTNLYLYNHTEQLILPGPDAFENGSIILENGNEMNLYIRCRDKNGNTNNADYGVRFCVDETPDNTAPQVLATSINNRGCIAADTDTAEVEFYIDEPSQCRWSPVDQDYDSMDNEMICSDEIYQINALQTYTCRADLTGIARDETTFYIRCKDQKDKAEVDRNENKQSYEFRLRGSTDLKMLNLQPNKTIYGSVNPAPVELYVETLFGCDNGKAICYYSDENREDSYIMFFDTNTDDGIHTQRLDLTDGNYEYFYKCVDSGGNAVIDSTEFRLDIDVNAPVVARVYEEDGMLKIVTVRNSECAYSFDNCDFSFAEGTEMPYANTKNHVVEWNEDKTYYIKCRDEFKNEEADCSVVVRPTKNFL